MDTANEKDALQARVSDLERKVAQLSLSRHPRGIRRRSDVRLFGLPLYEIALGPDGERGEMRGHARAIIAIGDIATGVFAFGGLARGVVAIGGCALGLAVGMGGLAIGALAIGGAAIGGIALGGGAVGFIAGGGGALGYYATGGEAFGRFVLSPRRQDPEAMELVRQSLSWLEPFLE